MKLFNECRNYFIKKVDNPLYKFTAIEGKQLKNILERLSKGIAKKYGLQGDELTETVYKAFIETIEFADNNGFTLTMMNVINKFNNIMQMIKNEKLGKHNKGFNPNQNTWINTLKADYIHTGTNELLDNGIRQIGNGKARSDTASGNNGVD